MKYYMIDDILLARDLLTTKVFSESRIHWGAFRYKIKGLFFSTCYEYSLIIIITVPLTEYEKDNPIRNSKTSAMITFLLIYCSRFVHIATRVILKQMPHWFWDITISNTFRRMTRWSWISNSSLLWLILSSYSFLWLDLKDRGRNLYLWFIRARCSKSLFCPNRNHLNNY